MVRREAARFNTPDGIRLFRRSWLPARPRRALVLVHGFAEHSGRYEHFGAWFAARDSAVHAYDHRGHGRSEGLRSHVGRFDEYLDDLERILERVRAEHPDLPLELVGHSMGGLVVTALLCERKPDVLCAAVSAPALQLGEDVTRTRQRAARLLRRLAPRLTMLSGLDPNGLSRDPDVVRAYLEDPLVERRMTVSLASELLSAVARTAEGAGRVQVPMLLMHGEGDMHCPAAGSRRFHAGLQGPGHRLRLYPTLRHEIFNEPEQDAVFEDLLSWLREREA